MTTKRFAAVHLATSVASALFFAAGAAAQDARTPDARTTTGSAPREIPSTVPQAPVGHRQPKLYDLPPESRGAATNTERSQRDRELDKILEICRGC
jgi:dihydroorotate dehydrogenase